MLHSLVELVSQCLQRFFMPGLLWIRSFVICIPLIRHSERYRLLHSISISVLASEPLSAVIPSSIMVNVSVTQSGTVELVDWKIGVAFALLFHKLLWLILLYFLIRFRELIDLGLWYDPTVLCWRWVSFELSLTYTIQRVRRCKRVSLSLIMLHLIS